MSCFATVAPRNESVHQWGLQGWTQQEPHSNPWPPHRTNNDRLASMVAAKERNRSLLHTYMEKRARSMFVKTGSFWKHLTISQGISTNRKSLWKNAFPGTAAVCHYLVTTLTAHDVKGASTTTWGSFQTALDSLCNHFQQHNVQLTNTLQQLPAHFSSSNDH